MNTAVKPLARADVTVQRPKGHATKNGVAWSCDLMVRQMLIAKVSHEGNGGCCRFVVVDTNTCAQLFEDAKALAIKLYPRIEFEQLDHMVGLLWDKAFTSEG